MRIMVKMLLQWILVLLILIPFFLFISVLIPQTQWGLAIFWFIALTTDLYSTHQFYIENSSQFSQNERNKVFILLTEKLGFQKAAIIFPIIFEIPLLLFFAILPLQTLYIYMFDGSSFNLSATIATSLGIAGVGHMQATTRNRHYTEKK